MVKRLLYLNGLAIIGAILYHAAGWGFVAMFWWTDRYRPVVVPNFDQFGSVSYFGLRAIEQAIIFAIPAFLFVSGFFLAFATGRTRSTVGWNVVFMRVKNLLIPFILWSIVILAVDILLGNSYSPGRLIVTVITGQATAAFYFVPVLIQLYLLSPFLIPLAKTHWKLLLAIAGFIQIVTNSLRYFVILDLPPTALEPLLVLTRSWLFPGFIFWFTLGIVVGFHNQALKQWLSKAKWFLLVVMGIFFAAGMFEWEALLRASGQEWITPKETLLDNFYSLAFLLVFLAFDQYVFPFVKGIEQLGSKSYGIYLTHSLVLTFASKIIYHLAAWVLQYQIIYLPLLIMLALGVPMAFMTIVSRSPARKIYAYLFG